MRVACWISTATRAKARAHSPTSHARTRARAHTHTQICNICCFSTATTVRRTRLLRYTYTVCVIFHDNFYNTRLQINPLVALYQNWLTVSGVTMHILQSHHSLSVLPVPLSTSHTSRQAGTNRLEIPGVNWSITGSPYSLTWLRARFPIKPHFWLSTAWNTGQERPVRDWSSLPVPA